MKLTTTQTETFLAIVPERRQKKAAAALETLRAEPLYAVDYKAAKEQLSLAVEEAWTARVSVPFTHGLGVTPEGALSSDLSPYGLHAVPAKLKKLNRMKPETRLFEGQVKDVKPEALAAMRAVLEAAAPVAELAKALKDSVVKGRKPAGKPSADKLAKEAAKQTCPCCFRPMTIKGGLVVRHGWEEVGGRRAGHHGYAYHMGSCFGVGYEPYEVSCQGTKDFLAKVLVPQRADLEDELTALVARPAKLTVTYTKAATDDTPEEKLTRDRYGRARERVTVELEDDGVSVDAVQNYLHGKSRENPAGTYAWNLKNRIRRTEGELRAVEMLAGEMERKVADWKPAE